MALLLLRSSVGLLLIACVWTTGRSQPSSILTLLAGVLCVGLTVGILTPFLSGAAFLGGAMLVAIAPACFSLIRIATLELCLTVSLLGAGAYSLDAVLFGKRRIIL